MLTIPYKPFTLLMLAVFSLPGIALHAQDKPVSAKEIALGAKQYLPAQQSQGGLYQVDPGLQAYVSRVGQKLGKASIFPDLPYEFVVINSNDLNAWALPGGKIAINRGLLVDLSDEAQLAAVLAHEISHVTKRHSARMQNKATGAGLLGALVGIGVGMKVPALRDIGMQAGSAIAFAGQANYSRDHEIQADNEGIKLMVKAGYDPLAAVEIQQLFLKQSQARKSNALEALFASHPPSQERVTNNQQKIKKYPSGGFRGKNEYQQAIAAVTRDKPAYALYQDAQKAYAAKNYTLAESLSSKAIALQPKEYLFWEFKGVSLFQQKKNRESLAAFDKAIGMNARFFRPYLYRGLAYQALSDMSKAESSLTASINLLPTQIAIYHLGEIAEQRGDRETAARHYTTVAQAGGELGRAAQIKLSRL